MIKGISVTSNLQVKSKVTEMTSRNCAMHLKSLLFKHVKDEERVSGKHLPHPNYAFLWINYCKWLVTCFQLNYVHWLDRTQSTCSCFTGRIFPALFHLVFCAVRLERTSSSLLPLLWSKCNRLSLLLCRYVFPFCYVSIPSWFPNLPQELPVWCTSYDSTNSCR